MLLEDGEGGIKQAEERSTEKVGDEEATNGKEEGEMREGAEKGEKVEDEEPTNGKEEGGMRGAGC
jgi:hypothetical protein